jgi:hypothetical protein
MDNTSTPIRQPVLDPPRSGHPGLRSAAAVRPAPADGDRPRPFFALNPASIPVCFLSRPFRPTMGNESPTAALDRTERERRVLRPERSRTLALATLCAAAVLVAVLHVATVFSVAAHHHSEAGGSSSCLICVGASSPAAANPGELSPAPAPAISSPLPPAADSLAPAAAPVSVDVRAPPTA